jgi:hypothetical protein
VIRVDGDLFNRPGPRLPLAARLLAEALHPGAFSPEGGGGGSRFPEGAVP